jgi:hypothetical protein
MLDVASGIQPSAHAALKARREQMAAPIASGPVLDQLLEHIERDFMLFLSHGDETQPYSVSAKSYISAVSEAFVTELKMLKQRSARAAA